MNGSVGVSMVMVNLLCLLNYMQLYSWFILNNYYVVMVYLVCHYIFLNILYIVLVTLYYAFFGACFHTVLFPSLYC